MMPSVSKYSLRELFFFLITQLEQIVTLSWKTEVVALELASCSDSLVCYEI